MNAIRKLLGALALLFALSVAGQASATWYTVSSYIPSGGPVAASASPGSIGNVWDDLAGSQWAINSSNQIYQSGTSTSPYNLQGLYRPTTEAFIDSQIQVYAKTSTSTINTECVALRWNNVNQTGYAACYRAGIPNIQIYSNGVTTGQVSLGICTSGVVNVGTSTAFSLLGSVVQTSGSVTTVSLTLINSGGTTLATCTETDSSTADGLQGVTGVDGIYQANSAETPSTAIQITQLVTSTDTTATAITVSSPTGETIGNPTTFAIGLNGALSSGTVNVGYADGGRSGTFSPAAGTGVNLSVGAQSQNFTYTPALAGSTTLTTTNNGSGITNGSTTFAVAAPWVQVETYTPTGGAVAASTNPGSIGGGWIDNAGSDYAINASNQIVPTIYATTPYSNYPLLRPNSEAQVNGRIQVKMTAVTTGDTMCMYLRVTPVKNSGYSVCYQNSGTVAFYTNVNAPGVQIGAYQTTTAPVAGTTYTLDASVVQTTSSTSTLSFTLENASGTAIASTLSQTDTTPAFQNISGTIGYYAAPASASVVDPVISLNTYNQQATSYSINGPAYGPLSLPSSFTIQATGPVASPGAAFTLTDSGAGGTFSTTTPQIATGGNSVNFSYTPTSASVISITSTNNDNLTNPSANSFTPANLLLPSSAAAHFNPATWSCIGSVSCFSGQTSPCTWHPGANVTYVWNASSSPIAILELPTQPSSTSLVTYFLNGVMYPQQPMTGPITLSGVVPNASNMIVLYLNSNDTTNRWNNCGSQSGNTLTINGLLVDSSSSAGVAPTYNSWAMIIGASKDEGYHIDNGVENFVESHIYADTQQLQNVGIDVAYEIDSSMGWSYSGSGGVPGYYPVTGSTTGLNGTYSGSGLFSYLDQGISALDANGQFTAYGAVNTPPYLILAILGENDLHGTGTTNTEASEYQALVAIRRAAPAAKIINQMCIPCADVAWTHLGTYTTSSVASYYSFLQAGAAAYQTNYPGDGAYSTENEGAAFAAQLFSNYGAYSILGNTAYVWTDDDHLLVSATSLVSAREMAAIWRALNPQQTVNVQHRLFH